MKLNICLLTSSLVSCLFINSAIAGIDPKPMSADSRVKTVVYNENDVYQVQGHYGYSTVIELSKNENIETISLGDTQSWQVMKPGKPNIVFIKPLEEEASTNMTIITDRRIYTFELTADQAYSPRSSELTFRLRFHYAEEIERELAFIGSTSRSSFNSLENNNPVSLNFDYSFSGSRNLRPLRAFDDGSFTYFQFETFKSTPAVFAVDEQGNERLVNFNIQGKYLVVAGVGSQFTLRDGKIETCIFNQNAPIETPQIIDEATPIDELEYIDDISITNILPTPAHKPTQEVSYPQNNSNILSQLFPKYRSNSGLAHDLNLND